jgi:hypothetical protein
MAGGRRGRGVQFGVMVVVVVRPAALCPRGGGQSKSLLALHSSRLSVATHVLRRLQSSAVDAFTARVWRVLPVCAGWRAWGWVGEGVRGMGWRRHAREKKRNKQKQARQYKKQNQNNTHT